MNTLELLAEFRLYVDKYEVPYSPMVDLMNLLDFSDAVNITLKYMKMFLPRFEFYYPQDTWVRNALDMVEKGEQIKWDNPILKGIEKRWDRLFTAPGCYYFVAGVYELIDLMSYPDGLLHRGHALQPTIHGIEADAWASRNPLRWMIYNHFMKYRVEITDEMDEDIIFWMQRVRTRAPFVLNLRKQLWTDVGNDIETKLTKMEMT